MHLLTTLLLAHLFADFPLQTNKLARWKKTSIHGVLIHVVIYMAITALLLQQPLRFWPLILGLGAVHFAIDALKKVCPLKNEVHGFLLDQLMHILTVLLATYLAYQYWGIPPVGVLADHYLYPAFIYALTLATMVFCWVWVQSLHEKYLQQYSLLRWVKHQALTFEQQTGMALIALILVAQLVTK
ncbi:MAG: DUF3307 domain-containing protein [Caldilineaceae bacterium]